MSSWLCYPSPFLSPGTITLAGGTVLQVPAGYEEDTVYINNEPYMIDGPDETLQNIRKDLKTFLGECFTNTSKGTPWTQLILIKSPTQADAALKTVIKSADGVISLTAFNFTLSRDKATVTFSVESQSGPLNGVVSFNTSEVSQ